LGKSLFEGIQLRERIMNSIRAIRSRVNILAAASAASLALVSSAYAQSNVGVGQVVISSSGSTALKNWFVAKTTTFTDVQPGTTLSINGTTYPPASDGGVNYWGSNGGPGISYQLAPKNNTTSVTGSPTDQSAAIQFVYHESGSVEGVLELANDQLYTNSDYAPATGISSTSIPYITANVDRNPEGGNAVWLNYNQIGASGVTAGAAFNATTGAAPGGTTVTLGNFYGSGVGQNGTPGQSGTPWTPGSASNPTPTFNQAGVNQSGGQNAVQLAVSDAVPQQIFQNNYGNTSNTYTPAGGGGPVTVTGVANTSFNSNPLDLGYGAGNSALSAGSLGTPGSRTTYQSPNVLNMPATAQNPRVPQGTTFGVGAWNNATNGGLGNLNSQLTAITATAFVANPGTGLTQVDRTDANWLEMTSRLANGAGFNMTTRDVNSGTRDVSSLDTGVDPTYSTGKNDNGNGNAPNGVSNAVFDQESIGPAQRFSNKTAGGAQLRPTVQNNRMAVGTLSINDAGGNDTQGIANPVRVLNYSDSTDGSAPYVSPNYATISNGTYVIYQNEQVVTLRTPGANYATNIVVTAGNGAQLIQGTVQGDDSSGDVVSLLNNTANSVATANSATSPVNPADGLLSQGYIIPSLMQVQKNFNGEGLNNSVAGQIATGSIVSQTNPNFNAALYATYSAPGGYGQSALPNLTTQEPTTGTGSQYGAKGGTFAKSFYNGGAISITANNYLFGNFNQTGTRDFNSAVKSALAADRALITADLAVGASVAGSEFTSQGDNNGVAGGTNGILNSATVSYTDALGVAHTTLTKGDLIVMGDFTGDGHFDGADLVAMAENAAESDNTGTDRLSSATYQIGVLDKNAAMDYLNTTVGTTGTDLYIRQSGRQILEGTSIPAGATAVLSPITAAQVIDPVSGLKEFSFDPNGANTFNKSDVNQDGVVDFNDAVVVDNNNGQDFSNIGDQVSATQQAPVTGAIEPLNLVMAKQSDGSTVIGASDVAVVNTQLTGTGITNWYGYNLQKTGPSTITFARTGGAVNVYTGASFEVSSGTVQIGGAVDPFSGTGATAGHHVALAVDHVATVQFLTSSNAAGSEVAGLSIDGTSVLDLTNNILKVDYAPGTQASADATIRSYLINGRNGGSWNGVGGISSSTAALPANSHYALGYADGADNIVAGLSSGQIEIRYTLLGDADLDGAVTGSDFTLLASNLGKGVSRWDQGDFDYDGSVTGSDFTDLVGNLGKSASGAAVQLPASDYVAIDAFAAANGLMADVPEPASASLLIIAGMGVLSRRRRSV
jgi:hypothetical protein